MRPIRVPPAPRAPVPSGARLVTLGSTEDPLLRSSLVRLAVPGWLATLAPFAAAASPCSAQDVAARLVPSDAVVLVRVESFDAWNAFVRTFEPIAGDGSLASYDAAALFASMQDPSVAEPGVLDPARAVWFALSFPP